MTLLGALAVLAAACGADPGTLLAITIAGVSPEVSTLRLTATATGQGARVETAASDTYVGIQVPSNLKGHLLIEAAGLQGDRCFQARGTATGTLDGQRRIDLTVTLRGLAGRQCPVQIERQGAGSGRVTSEPKYFNCGVQCVADVPTGSRIVLLATAEGQTGSASLSGGCEGPSGATSSCELLVSGPVSVIANFQP